MHQPLLPGHNGTSSGSFVWGILCGAAIGAAAAVMCAPRTGSALRSGLSAGARKLRRRAEHVIDGAAETVGDLAGRGESAMHEVRRAADQVSESVGGRRRETL